MPSGPAARARALPSLPRFITSRRRSRDMRASLARCPQGAFAPSVRFNQVSHTAFPYALNRHRCGTEGPNAWHGELISSDDIDSRFRNSRPGTPSGSAAAHGPERVKSRQHVFATMLDAAIRIGLVALLL